MGAEYLAPTVIRSPDRPARRKSLYRLALPTLGLSILAVRSLTHALIEDGIYMSKRVGMFFVLLCVYDIVH